MDDSTHNLDNTMGILSKLPFAFHSGDNWRYSMATDVLAHVIERATGERIDCLLKKYNFGTIGMLDTTYGFKDDQLPRLMSLYENEDLVRLPTFERVPYELRGLDVSHVYPNQSIVFFRGGHGLYSTLNDYCAFILMLLSGKSDAGEQLLSQRTLSMMHANKLPDSHHTLRIGIIVLPRYGWNLTGRIMTNFAKAHCTHAIQDELRWAGAARTYFWVDPRGEITGVIMTQFIRSNFLLSDDMMTVFYGSLQKVTLGY